MRSRLAWIIAGAVALASCGGGSPTSPSGSGGSGGNTQTRVITVSGNLAFGDVGVGASRDATITIANSGNATLTVSSLSISGGLSSVVTASWTSGTIAPGASQTVTVRAQPTAAGALSGTLTVNGDQTSGTNSLAVSVNGVASFTGTWRGGHTVTQCNGTGSAQDLICGAARGAYKVGTNFIFDLTLTQTGNTVAGTANLAGPSGPVTGTVTNGVLTLTGTLRDNQGFTSVITAWSTTISGSSMSGSLGYSLTFSGVPGNAAIVATLNNVTRQ